MQWEVIDGFAVVLFVFIRNSQNNYLIYLC